MKIWRLNSEISDWLPDWSTMRKRGIFLYYSTMRKRDGFRLTSQSKLTKVIVTNTKASPFLDVKKWVDYSTKYGSEYLFLDGSAGVYFNDSAKIMIDRQESNLFLYFSEFEYF